MKNMLKGSLLLVLALAIALPLTGQENKKKKKKTDAPANPLANYVKELSGKVDLSDDQAKKIDELAAEYGKKIAEANKKIGAARQDLNAARKKLSEEGKKGKELKEAVEASVTLTDEQKAGLKESQDLNAAFRKDVAGLLDEGQREKAGLNQKKGKKKNKDN